MENRLFKFNELLLAFPGPGVSLSPSRDYTALNRVLANKEVSVAIETTQDVHFTNIKK